MFFCSFCFICVKVSACLPRGKVLPLVKDLDGGDKYTAGWRTAVRIGGGVSGAWFWPNLVLPRRWAQTPEPIHLEPGQLCIKQASFCMTWCQCYVGPWWPLRRALTGLDTPPQSSHPGASHPHRELPGHWLAPYLTLWGARVLPQELVPHLITVGNTWPFLKEEEEVGQRRRGEREQNRGGKKTRGKIRLNRVDLGGKKH